VKAETQEVGYLATILLTIAVGGVFLPVYYMVVSFLF